MSGSRWRESWYRRGVAAGLGAAALFGLGTPASKALLSDVNPWLLAGLLYLGSGVGLSLWRLVGRSPKVRPAIPERLALGGAIAFGGVCGPVLLMKGLSGMPASGASLLLNAEAVFTALLAWFVFRENFDRRIALGMVAIAAGAVVLSWDAHAALGGGLSALFVLGACLSWAIDNNFTRKIALLESTWVAAVKGLVAGGTNLLIALLAGSHWPRGPSVAGALLVGAFAYGASLASFVVALRYLGAARTAAYFSVAPFVGAVFAIVWLKEPVTYQFLIAGGLMLIGVWLHLSEKHSHSHVHPALEHEHEHEHDLHHQHLHGQPVSSGMRHTHRHRHEPIEHAHEHFPDSHHQHDHE